MKTRIRDFKIIDKFFLNLLKVVVIFGNYFDFKTDPKSVYNGTNISFTEFLPLHKDYYLIGDTLSLFKVMGGQKGDFICSLEFNLMKIIPDVLSGFRVDSRIWFV